MTPKVKDKTATVVRLPTSDDEEMEIEVDAGEDREQFPMEDDSEEGEIGNTSQSEDEDSEDDAEIEFMGRKDTRSTPNSGRTESQNNNALVKEVADFDDEVRIAPIDCDASNKEEFDSMMRFAQFMHKQGFITKNEMELQMEPPEQMVGSKTKSKTGTRMETNKKGKVLQGQALALKRVTEPKMVQVQSATSEETICQKAILMPAQERNTDESNKRDSSSSGGPVNISEEIEMEVSPEKTEITSKVNDELSFCNFIEARLKEYRDGLKKDEEVRPSTSAQPDQKTEQSAEQAHALADIKMAEQYKGKLNEVSGNLAHSVFVDEDYAMMGGMWMKLPELG